jgi:hypothetical protein
MTYNIGIANRGWTLEQSAATMLLYCGSGFKILQVMVGELK